ncbi:MAG: sulfatase-like hydrolase/transferase, partial [Candidatus Sumerlaeota bacterium]|nr:sulfatase-like hydrolase/transferase [Candidatus Sumerlaeota bacterium]
GAMSVTGGRTFIRRGIPTIADMFLRSGYRTGHFGKWHLGDNWPFRPQDRGFEETIHIPSIGITATPDYWNNDYFDDYYRHNGKIQQYMGYCTDVWFTEAMRWMDACAGRNEPFFCYLATNSDHVPLFVPDYYRDPYRHLHRDVASFFGMIANFDENLGRLNSFLEETGIGRNSILVFMTDNGGTFGVPIYNAGMRGQKCSLYEGGHRVPCFVRAGDGSLGPPRDIDALTQCQDIAPTLVELCNLDPAGAEFDGRSLVSLMRGEREDFDERILVMQYQRMKAPLPGEWDAGVMWRRWRLVSGTELYDLESDPGQTTNIAERNPEIVTRLRAHYERWWAGIAPRLAEPEPISVGAEQENPACLCAIDWQFWGSPNFHSMVRIGRPIHGILGMSDDMVWNGHWNVLVERAGEYEISLRRWPEESGVAIRDAAPAFEPADPVYRGYTADGTERVWLGWCGLYMEGTPLPIASARLRVGDTEVETPVGEGDQAAVFRMQLSRGQTTVRTSFRDAQGKELAGAFYVYVERIE